MSYKRKMQKIDKNRGAKTPKKPIIVKGQTKKNKFCIPPLSLYKLHLVNNISSLWKQENKYKRKEWNRKR